MRFGCLGVLLCEGRGDEGGCDAATLASGMGEQVAHQMHAAALPRGIQHPGNCGLQSFMGIGDHQLHATQATASELAQELGPECLGLGETDIHAEDLAPAVVVDPTAMITATETMRPAWRTFT